MKSRGRYRHSLRDSRGVSLIETLIASAIFILFVTALGLMGFSGVDLTLAATERMRAISYAEEGIEAMRSLRLTDPETLVSGTYGIATTTTGWALVGGMDERDELRRSVTVTELGGGRRRIDVRVSRIDEPVSGDINLTTYLHDLYGTSWTQSTVMDFLAGGENGSVVAPMGDGAVGLRYFGDWTAPKIIATGDLPGAMRVRMITEEGGTLYAAGDVSGEEFAMFYSSDVSEGNFPKRRTVNIDAIVNAFALSGRYAFLATTDNAREIVVVRLSDGAIVNQLDLPTSADATAIIATGTRLYVGRVSSSQPELLAISIANPEGALSILRSMQFNGTINALTIGPTGHIFGGTTSNAAEVVAFDPETLSLVNSLDLPGNADVLSLVVSGSSIYIGRASSADDELYIVDASDPTNSFVIGDRFQLPSSSYGVSVGEDGMIVASTLSSTQEIVLLRPSPLRSIGTFDIPNASGARSVLLHGAHIYTGLNSASTEIVVLRGGSGAWENARVSGAYDSQGTADGRAVYSDGARAYLGTANQSAGPELYILDVTDPLTPFRLGELDLGGQVNGITVSWPFAYIALSNSSRELTIVNVANPATPSIVGSYNAPGSAAGTSVVASGTTVYLGTANNTRADGRELYAIDVSNPAAPVLRGTLEVGATVNAVTAGGGWVFLATAANSKEFIVVDPSVANLREASSYDTPSAADGLSLAWTDEAGGFVALGTQNNGTGYDYYHFRIAESGLPTLRGFLDLNANNYAVAISEGIAFVGNDQSGGRIRTIHAEDPGAPVLIGSVPTGGAVRAISPFASAVSLATTMNSREFAIVRPMTIPIEFAPAGWFTSSRFDAGADVAWQTISWSGSGTGTIAFQIRTASTDVGLEDARWVGPDGTDETVFLSPLGIVLDPLSSGSRWVQYRVTLVPNGLDSPHLEEVRLTYN